MTPSRRARRAAVRWGAGAAALLLAWISPPVREALVALEPMSAATLFVCAVTGRLIAALAQRRGPTTTLRQRRRERRLSAALERWGATGAVLLFLLPVWSHWDMRPPGVSAAHAALVGHIPWADSHGHLEGASRLLAGDRFGAFSERRPINAPWLAARIAVAGVDGAVAIQAMVLGVAALLAARAVGLRHGVWSGLAMFALTLGLAREYLPTVLTEPLGVTFGCLAVALLVPSGARRRARTAALGVFAVGLALAARPGPQFLLPLLALWALVQPGRSGGRPWAGIAAALIVPMLLASLVNRAYGLGEGSLSSYPAYTFYGLAHNADYRLAKIESRQLPGGREVDAAPVLYRKALAHVLEQPSDLVAALRRNADEFRRMTPANLARPLSLRWLTTPAALRVRPTRDELAWDMALGGSLLAATAIAFIVFLARRAERGEALLWCAVAAGTVISAAFVYGDSGFRVLAAAYPFFAAFFAAGLTAAGDPPAATRRERTLTRQAALSGLGIVVVLLAGPVLARLVRPRPPQLAPPASQVQTADVLVVRLRGAPMVLVTNLPRERGEARAVPRREFGWMLEMAGADGRTELAERRPPFLLASAYDHAGRRQRVLVGPPEMAREQERFLRVEALSVGPAEDEGRRIFEVVAFSPI